MQILSAEQIRSWDKYTMENEPITSIDLMERAASKCFEWINEKGYQHKPFTIFCGKGNNGGDGLALARMLSINKYKVVVYILEFGHKGTDDFQANLAKLHQTSVEILFIQTIENFHPVPEENIIIDALFGSGLNRPLDGVTQKLVEFINKCSNEIISIDLPSGLFTDKSSKGNPVINAKHTLSFQCYKLALLVAENGKHCGEVHILDIGLHKDYLNDLKNKFTLVDKDLIKSIFKPRDQFANKGNFGHALLICGSYGKMGAAILSAKACLRSGAGLLTIHIPKCGYEIIQISIPEAMASIDKNEHINATVPEEITKYTTIGIGPGIGKDAKTKILLSEIFQQCKKPMVVDADALNIISENNEMLDELPSHSIITPHPKEFERLFGKSENDFDAINKAVEKAIQYKIIIVLKGHHTFIALPDGCGFFNATGNAGMAKGGSGDVLTGIVTAFVAQKYSSEDAAVLAVYFHGLAGDYAASYYSMESMLATDITDCVGQAILSIQ
jgi:hydroxyethylthiazole kinase-like uncharacterized protein yjeF